MKLGVVPWELLTLLVLLMIAFAASRAALLVSNVDGLLAAGTLWKLSIASKCTGGVGLLETRISEEMLTGRMSVGEFGRGREDRT